MAGAADSFPARYVDAEPIGHGGMGEIYRATDTLLDRDVAIKLLAARYAGETEVRERFTREALAAARLSSDPNVVTIFDVGEHAGRPFIVMEHLPGGSLEDVLARDGAQPPGRALAWLSQAAGALDRAHAQGVVHRDVKPANLLLDRSGDVHVADFGIASAAGLDSFTRPGTVLGTAGYLSPEQARGERATPASDRYALAVVAYELLAGTRPFARDNPTAEAAAHVQAPVPPISGAGAGLPRELDAVFARALAKEPGERYGSCAELVSSLRHALDAEAGATRVAAAPAHIPERTLAAGRPRRRGGLAVAAVGLAVLGGVVAWALTDGGAGGAEGTGTVAVAPRTVVSTLVTTQPGTTREVTVTSEAEPAPTTQAEAGGSVQEGVALTDESTGLIREERYEEALPVAQRALTMLQGSGELYEAYANYNVGRSLLGLGRCAEAIPYLDRSEAIQGERKEITRDRKAAAKCA
ncbi:MAG TPA: protein kinase [Gaiellaceae bacterium]|nr:protein kinase [Gaiellaceae bacterium]